VRVLTLERRIAFFGAFAADIEGGARRSANIVGHRISKNFILRFRIAGRLDRSSFASSA
jgi:hypothetical protein